MMNKLVNLFDDTVSSPNKISKYVESERKLRGMDEATAVGKAYGENTEKSTLLLEIIKRNKVLLHITFHLSPYSLEPENTGAIHITKNIYRKKQKIGKNRYSLIRVHTPIGKDKSLEFSIADGYKTPGINVDEKELQKEMDVIIYVINRIFDEYDPYYIGIEEEIINVSLKINSFLNSINTSTVKYRI